MKVCAAHAEGDGVLEFFAPVYSNGKAIPLYYDPVHAGFPSPAEDYTEEQLDPYKFLVRNPVATFFVRVQGSSMQNTGIGNGDLLVVDRSITPKNGDIVVCSVNNLFTVKRLNLLSGGGVRLQAANPQFAPIVLQGIDELIVFGVVTFSIRSQYK